VVGTSISYVVLFMNFAKMLTMSGIPLRWADRVPEEHPMIVVGGQSYCAPEPMAPVADCIFLGEAEDEPGNGGIGQVCRMIEMLKAEGLWNADRVECYRRLARAFNYLYFPRFVDVEYGVEDRRAVGCELPSRQVHGYSSNLSGMRMPFRKRHVIDLDKIKPLDNPPLLFTDPSLGAGDLETSRGCPAWCSFCRLTYAQKPFRQRSVGYVTEFARAFQRNVGGTELSPFGPDFPMQTNKKRMIKALLENVSDEVDAVAMRVDDFAADDQYVLLQAFGGSESITLGLEGNSQRMRDLVGKGTSEAEVRDAVTKGIRAGFKKFKLFMITNLPGEDSGDLAKIMQLARDLADIRDSMGAGKVRIQFSWTPLLIEAKTPFQWFAPTIANHDLIDVSNALNELRIDFKIGAKAEPNKVAFFQLCQRASRDVGEAIVDVLAQLDSASWGGVPRDMRDRLDAALVARGFANGFSDCFDERFEHDLFGWEFIDTGVSDSLLWSAYEAMREFAEQTDSRTYDETYGSEYHGNEWIQRCDERCMGRACGACSGEDLKLRAAYIAESGHDEDIDLTALHPVDQSSLAFRVRAQLTVPERHRFVEAAHWRYSIRRAAYQAQHRLGTEAGVTKHAVHLASERLNYKDWSCGTDYAEWGMTRRMKQADITAFVGEMAFVLKDWLQVGHFQLYPAASRMAASADLSLYELELPVSADQATSWLQRWDDAGSVRLLLRALHAGYFQAATEEVNAKDYASDLWLARDGSRLMLKMLLRDRAGPYQVYAALSGKASWIEAAAAPAVRLGAFTRTDASQGGDLLRPSCAACGQLIPVSLLDEPWGTEFCPRHEDEDAGRLVAGLREHEPSGAES
jgi:radical SAM superfamily enzyme YgiQ (UPF0313 family)